MNQIRLLILDIIHFIEVAQRCDKFLDDEDRAALAKAIELMNAAVNVVCSRERPVAEGAPY